MIEKKGFSVIEAEGNSRVALWQSALIRCARVPCLGRHVDESCCLTTCIIHAMNDEWRNAQQAWLILAKDKNVEHTKRGAAGADVVQNNLKTSIDESQE